jgi:hypothetical protein
VLDREPKAWQELWAAIQPTVWAITGKWQIVGPLARRDDERRNIVVDVMQRLRDQDFRRLRLFVATPEGATFKSWLATLTARAAIDYVRAHPEFTDRRGADPRGRWVQYVPADRVADTLFDPKADPAKEASVCEVLGWAKSCLSFDQLRAVSMWLEGEDHAAIAASLSLGSGHDADKLVRSGLKRLRDRLTAIRSSSASASPERTDFPRTPREEPT